MAVERMGCGCSMRKRKLEEVVDGGGHAVALRCPICTTIVCMLGSCPGCGMPECRLCFVVESGDAKSYYHAEACAAEHSKKQAKAKRERIQKFRASQTKIPGCE